MRECPACLSRNSYRSGQKSDYEILKCAECGSLFTAKFPAVAEAQDYDDYYSEANLSVPEFTHRRLDEIVAGFDRYRRTTRFLEIGFGAGSFLEAAKRAEWEVDGVEVSQSACEHSRADGFKVFCGELAEAKYPDGAFDVVVASELMEHVADPVSLLQEVARIVRPGGLFWATTPNARGLSSRWLGTGWSVLSPPEHLHLFSGPGVKRLLLKVGFSRVAINTEGLNPFELVKKFRRHGAKPSGTSAGTERVNSGYKLAESLSCSPTRNAIKKSVNGLLRISRLGDSLKIWADR